MTLVLLLASLASGIIQGIPGISSTIKSTIGAIVGSLSAIVASGVTVGVSEATILAALSGVLTALKGEPNIPAATLQLISGLEDAIAAALTEDKVAAAKVDPTTLNPIVPIP